MLTAPSEALMSAPRRHRAAAVLALVGATLLSGVQAQMPAWKWRDAQGRIQYSDRAPPQQVPDKDILQRPAARSSAEPAAPTASAGAASAAGAAGAARPLARASGGQDPVLEARRKQQETAEADKRKAEEDKRQRLRQENCERSKEYMRSLNDGLRIARTGPNGERAFLSDAERAQETARTRELISSECQSPP
jgi:Domain of unknown function (DUF4124)